MKIIKRRSGFSPLAMVFCCFAALLLSACGGGSADGNPSNSPSGGGESTPAPVIDLTVLGPSNGSVGDTLTFLVVGGSPEYQVVSANTNVATVSDVALLGKLYLFSTTLKASGTTQLLLTDSSKKTATKDLTVTALPLKTSAGSAVTIAVGSEANYNVTGGGGFYSTTSGNTAVATASMGLGDTLTIKGVKVGTATITVCDGFCINATSISVTIGSGTASDTALFTTAAPSITMQNSTEATFAISGGISPYMASSSNDSVAIARVDGGVLTINSKAIAGSADITVKDVVGTSQVIAVAVSLGGAPLMTTAPLALTIGQGETTQTYTTSGGTAPYTCVSDNTSIATVSCTGNGASMAITGVADGKANILIQDATGSASKAVAVNVASGAGLVVTGSANWTIPKAHCNAPYTPYDPPIYSIYFINGGKPPYTVQSSNPLVGTIIAVGTNAAPVPPPSGAKSANTGTFTVQAGGHFMVAWPDAKGTGTGPSNHCAQGTATIQVKDANGVTLATPPTFNITLQD